MVSDVRLAWQALSRLVSVGWTSSRMQEAGLFQHIKRNQHFHTSQNVTDTLSFPF